MDQVLDNAFVEKLARKVMQSPDTSFLPHVTVVCFPKQNTSLEEVYFLIIIFNFFKDQKTSQEHSERQHQVLEEVPRHPF